jgi:hypothetical protein
MKSFSKRGGVRRGLLKAGMTLWLGLCAGCSDGRTTAPVSGKVTLDGQPLADVRLMFQPAEFDVNAADADATGSYATTDAQGEYTLLLSDSDEPGALVGEHRVTIYDKLTETDSDAGAASVKRSRIPPRYADGSLSFKVEPDGTDQANFELNSR